MPIMWSKLRLKRSISHPDYGLLSLLPVFFFLLVIEPIWWHPGVIQLSVSSLLSSSSLVFCQERCNGDQSCDWRMAESHGAEQLELLHCAPLHSNAQWGAADLPRLADGQSLWPHQETMVRLGPEGTGLHALTQHQKPSRLPGSWWWTAGSIGLLCTAPLNAIFYTGVNLRYIVPYSFII